MRKISLASVLITAVVLVAAALACNTPQQQESVTLQPTITATDPAPTATIEGDPAEAYAAALELTGTAIQQTLVAMSGHAAVATQPSAGQVNPPVSTPEGSSDAAGSSTTGELIESFTATSNVVSPDGDIVLNWSATGDSAELCYPYPNGGPVCSSVSLVGTETLNFDDALRSVESIEFTLTVRSGTASEKAVVLVAVTCPDVWFFEPQPPGCPASAGISTSAAVQRFEHGFMIWLDRLDLIYVFHQDPATDKVIDIYFTFTDPWESNLPEDDPTITPPDGYYQPKRGFGMVWRGAVDDETIDEQVRGLLGWATGPETAFESYYQGNTVGKYPSAYILGPDGEIIVVGASLSILTPTAVNVP